MLIGILSDIHDAVDSLKTTLYKFRRLGVHQVVSLGDAFETFKPRQPGAEVARLLREVGTIGVWGNHDFRLSHWISEGIRSKADPDLLEFSETLKPQLVVDNCRFSHVEPWLDPRNFEDLWHFSDEPGLPDNAKRSLEAVPEQFVFVGHYHHWAITNMDETIEWDATGRISLSRDQRYVVLMAAVRNGWSAVFESTKAQLTPLRVPCD